ncbi:hypothetical protein [Microbacterium sp. VKM Ac-2923]|uniref:hypothetical protein n=1 Tax=Microbacterium sp. VKM Ac-2923 TaxID=2929476 RepID=UPI001FB28AC1|nr:hypothetical protein [Microbacterium sp. VKM Ac-2923]MCJ1706822.1 hypothetical protein [Microbacterium sp. VKM Ac-2923]
MTKRDAHFPRWVRGGVNAPRCFRQEQTSSAFARTLAPLGACDAETGVRTVSVSRSACSWTAEQYDRDPRHTARWDGTVSPQFSQRTAVLPYRNVLTPFRMRVEMFIVFLSSTLSCNPETSGVERVT